jgi:Immunoglobulin I-set domain
MKRKLLNKALLKQLALSVPAAALMLGSSQGAEVGINFQADWAPYTSYTGKPVTATAFGIDPANWYNMDAVSTGATARTNQTITLPGGGTLLLSWSAENAWTSGIGADSTGTNVPPGIDEVVWGYLDDTSPGWSLTISGFRSAVSSFTLQAIAASDNATGFGNIELLTNQVIADVINFTNDPSQFIPAAGAGWGTSTVSITFATLAGNDSITLHGIGRSGSIRNTLAGLLLNYSTPANNPPLVESQPQAPTNTVFVGQSFSLSVTASGSLPLSYQWRKDGAAIGGATDSVLPRTDVTTADSGGYDVVVTNNFGSVTSQVATISISSATQPQVVQAPVSETFYAGYPATFTVVATGGELSYQWKKGGTDIPGATDATLALSNITTNDAGTYTVSISNAAGSTSASATLTVLLPAAPYPAAVASQLPLVYYRFSETGPLAYDTAANSGSLGTAGAGLYLLGARHPVGGALAGSTDTAAYFDGSGSKSDGALQCGPKPERVYGRGMVQSRAHASSHRHQGGVVLRRHGQHPRRLAGLSNRQWLELPDL